MQVWVSLPILLRLADRSIRWWRQNRAGSRITAAEFVGEDVVALEISRPTNFTFRSASVSENGKSFPLANPAFILGSRCHMWRGEMLFNIGG